MKSALMSMEDLAAPTPLTACDRPAKLDYWKMSRLVAGLEDENRKLRRANEALGAWLSAELRDESTCPEIKAVVVEWFEANRGS